jgi:hypothetical protein
MVGECRPSSGFAHFGAAASRGWSAGAERRCEICVIDNELPVQALTIAKQKAVMAKNTDITAFVYRRPKKLKTAITTTTRPTM